MKALNSISFTCLSGAMQKAQGAEGEWTIHIHLVEHGDGVVNHMLAKKKVSITVPSTATVQDFINSLHKTNEYPFNSATAMDLTPFDESKLGRDTKSYGRGYDPDEPPNWVPTHPNPRPVNCTWYPSLEDPQQELIAAGLCNGAELAIVKVSFWKG